MGLNTLEISGMDEKFLQEQLNTLQVSLAAQDIMTRNAMEAAGDNKKTLSTLHVRVDAVDKAVTDLGHALDNKPTKADMEEVVSDVINKGASALLWKAVVTLVGVAATGMAGWFMHGKG